MQAQPLLRILRQNIRRNLRSLVLSAFGIVVGIASFVFFWGLSRGVAEVVLHDIFPIDRVEVISPKTSLTGYTAPVDDALVDRIRARPEVRAAYPKMKMAFPAKGIGNLMGSEVRFEVGGFADGMDPVLAHGDPGGAEFRDWDAEMTTQVACTPATKETPASACPAQHFCAQDRVCRRRVPVLVSRTLIELYNGSFATAHGMPKIGAVQEAALMDRMKSMKFTIALGESYVAGSTDNLKAPPERVEAQLVGISDKAMPIGITVPIGYIKRWNTRYMGDAAAKLYSSVVVDLKDQADLGTFVPWVKSEGYEQEESQAERISLIITVVTALFLVIAFIICFISAVNISHTFFMMVSERRKEIGLMRALGATRADVWRIILGEAALIGAGGGVLGIALALAFAKVIDFLSAKQLPDYPFKPDTYFIFSPWLLVAAVAFAVLFCVVGAFLPARKAARIHPAQALLG